MAITATHVADQLEILGDTADNTILVNRDPGGTIFVNGGSVAVVDGPATVANTNLILISGNDGADIITLDETAGPLPAATVTGGRGNDIVTLGSGDDTFTWNSGDGSDTVEGRGGTDTLIFSSPAAAESIDLSANGSRVKLTSSIGAVTMDVNGVEKIVVQTLDRPDSIDIHDLAGTGVQQVTADLRGTAGGGNGFQDFVDIFGAAGGSSIMATQSGPTVLVKGLAAQISILGYEPGSDSLSFAGLGGNDLIDVSAVTGNVTVGGGGGNDILKMGSGNDFGGGGGGDDQVFLGDGIDTFQWGPGDGSDTIDGGGGADRLRFLESAAAENVVISASGTHAQLTRDVDSVTMNLTSVETIELLPFGGADTVTVNDLTSTGVQTVQIDLSGVNGGGDGSADNVAVTGTAGADRLVISDLRLGLIVHATAVTNASGVQTQITFSEAQDTLRVQGLGGDDIIDATGYIPGMALFLDGGDGNDTLIGSRFNDNFTGGAGDDTVVYAPGGKADIITDFIADSNVDKINLKAFSNLHTFNDVMALASQVGTSTVLDFGGGDTLTLQHVTKSNLDAGDFLLNGPAAALTVTTSGAGITGGNGDLNAGDTVTLTLAFDGMVTVAGGTPTLTLNDGGVATYTGGSGSTALTFQYMVASGENTADLAVAAVDRHGATLHDANGNDADLTNAVTNPAGILQIDTLAPHVNAVATSPASGNEPAGTVVTFTVTLSEAVNVAGGTPTLPLNDGGVATYTGGSGGTALTFQYTVASGENTADLAVTAVDRHGATLRDAAGNDADLTNAVTNPTGILTIDTLAPHVNAVSTSPASGDEPAGTVVTFTMTLNEAVNVAGGTPTLSLNDGGVATYTGGSGGTALTFQYTVASGENTADLAVTAVDPHGATLRDAAGNDADLANAITNPAGILTIDTLAPHVNAVSASPASGNETAGSTVTFTVTLNEAVNVAGGTPTLSLNDGGIAQYDAAATATLHDATRLVFDYVVSAADTPVASLAITGIDRHGASIADLATNAADFGNLATTFAGLGVNQGTDHGVDPHGFAPPHLADFFIV
jgi:Ca2+-binding RTX toxin-like protein